MLKDKIRERVFDSAPRPTKPVEAFGATIHLHRLSWQEMEDSRRGSIIDGAFDERAWRAAMLVLAARDDAGELIFGRADLPGILDSDGWEMRKLVDANMEHQGLLELQQGKADSEGMDGGEPSSASAAAPSGGSQAS